MHEISDTSIEKRNLRAAAGAERRDRFFATTLIYDGLNGHVSSASNGSLGSVHGANSADMIVRGEVHGFVRDTRVLPIWYPVCAEQIIGVFECMAI